MPLEEIAVLYRINARSEPFEEAFAAAGIPYQVRDGAFLRRPGPRSVLQRLKRAGAGSVAEAVEAITDALGYDPSASPDADEEVTRQSDLGRMRSLAVEFERAHPDGDARGVRRRARAPVLHRAQRPRREPAHVPPREGPRVRRRVPPAPCRRRAPVPLGPGQGRPRGGTTTPVRRDHARPPVPVPHLAERTAATRPSPFLDEMELAPSGRSRTSTAPGPAVTVRSGGAVFDRLKEWRRKRANADGVPAYVVFHDRTLAEIAERECKDWADLAAISGVGPAKLERYADEVLAIVEGG